MSVTFSGGESSFHSSSSARRSPGSSVMMLSTPISIIDSALLPSFTVQTWTARPRRWMERTRSPAAFALLMLAWAVASGHDLAIDTRPAYLASLIYLAVFGSVIAFGCYLTLLGRIGADRAAYAMVLFPVVALGISTVLEDYRWSASAIAGVCLVLAGNLALIAPGGLARIWRRPPGAVVNEAR